MTIEKVSFKISFKSCLRLNVIENVRLAHDITFYCENYKKPGAILFIDQSKVNQRSVRNGFK